MALDLANAKIFDFTGATSNGSSYKAFDAKVAEVLRQSTENKLAIVLDYGYGLKKNAPYLVLDHLNLSGSNPLSGPNNPVGERFPVVNGIYVTDFAMPAFRQLETGIAAGLKNELKPDAAEIEFLYSVGASFYCYNLVPTMLVAAHAGFKVLALVGPVITADTPAVDDWRSVFLQTVDAK